MSLQIKASDLRIKHQCTNCSKWYTAHAVPWGDPLAIFVTGYCTHCHETYLSMRSVDGNTDAIQPMLQLVGHLLQCIPHDVDSFVNPVGPAH